MSTLFPTNSADATPDADDHRPAYQSARADDAHPHADEVATEAGAGTPQYGDFGKPDSAASSAAAGRNDGSNDNPDEFSELDRPDDRGTDATSATATEQRGNTTQNQDVAAVRAAHDADTDEQRAAWSADDERYAGGHQKASWEENDDDEHAND